MTNDHPQFFRKIIQSDFSIFANGFRYYDHFLNGNFALIPILSVILRSGHKSRFFDGPKKLRVIISDFQNFNEISKFSEKLMQTLLVFRNCGWSLVISGNCGWSLGVFINSTELRTVLGRGKSSRRVPERGAPPLTRLRPSHVSGEMLRKQSAMGREFVSRSGAADQGGGASPPEGLPRRSLGNAQWSPAALRTTKHHPQYWKTLMITRSLWKPLRITRNFNEN